LRDQGKVDAAVMGIFGKTLNAHDDSGRETHFIQFFRDLLTETLKQKGLPTNSIGTSAGGTTDMFDYLKLLQETPGEKPVLDRIKGGLPDWLQDIINNGLTSKEEFIKDLIKNIGRSGTYIGQLESEMVKDILSKNNIFLKIYSQTNLTTGKIIIPKELNRLDNNKKELPADTTIINLLNERENHYEYLMPKEQAGGKVTFSNTVTANNGTTSPLVNTSSTAANIKPANSSHDLTTRTVDAILKKIEEKCMKTDFSNKRELRLMKFGIEYFDYKGIHDESYIGAPAVILKEGFDERFGKEKPGDDAYNTSLAKSKNIVRIYWFIETIRKTPISESKEYSNDFRLPCYDNDVISSFEQSFKEKDDSVTKGGANLDKHYYSYQYNKLYLEYLVPKPLFFAYSPLLHYLDYQ
jgi:hypothetical protein